VAFAHGIEQEHGGGKGQAVAQQLAQLIHRIALAAHDPRQVGKDGVDRHGTRMRGEKLRGLAGRLGEWLVHWSHRARGTDTRRRRAIVL